ncbi:MAG: methyltransferase [Oscillospiraceae bacterium]|nr:methyltransferase [Oscillospiraceae bacterium]
MPQYHEYTPGLPDKPRRFDYYFGPHRFLFETNSGVFSPDGVDEHTNVLLHALPPLKPGSSLLDLGCGWGVVGIVLAKTYGVQVTASDVNPRAVEMCRRNGELNSIELNSIQSHAFTNLPDRYDTILLNPPIHAGKDVLEALYEGAYEHLNPGGKFGIVLLDKHGAQSTLKHLTQMFSNGETLYRKKQLNVYLFKKADSEAEA